MEPPVVRYHATRQEIDLLEVIEEIGYGEIHSVTRIPGEPTEVIEITTRTRNFFVALKRIGKFRKILIHDREPAQAERHVCIKGYTGTARMRF